MATGAVSGASRRLRLVAYDSGRPLNGSCGSPRPTGRRPAVDGQAKTRAPEDGGLPVAGERRPGMTRKRAAPLERPLDPRNSIDRQNNASEQRPAPVGRTVRTSANSLTAGTRVTATRVNGLTGDRTLFATGELAPARRSSRDSGVHKYGAAAVKRNEAGLRGATAASSAPKRAIRATRWEKRRALSPVTACAVFRASPVAGH